MTGRACDLPAMCQRCCHILHVLPDLALGGGQQVVLRSITHADRQRFRFSVCYFQRVDDMARLFADQNVPLLFLPHSGWRAAMNLRRLIRYIRRQRVDLVHVHGTPLDKFYGMAAAACCGLPVVRTLHGMHMRYRRPSLPRLLARPKRLRRALSQTIGTALDALLEPRTIRHAIAVSPAVRRSWMPYLRRRGIGADRITLNVNAVPLASAQDSSEQALGDLRRQLGLIDASPILINIGRITTAKGQDLLIPVMARLLTRWPRAKLLLVGDGALRGPLQDEARRLGMAESVLFLGQRSDGPRLLCLADAFVFTSRFEGMPLAVLEAMAAGKPVIAVDIPGLRDVVEDGVTGRLVRRDADGLAEAVWNVLADRGRAAQMGSRAREVIQRHYDMDRFIRTLEGVYSSVLRQSSVDGPRTQPQSTCTR